MYKSFTKVSNAVGELAETDDVCMIRLHDEQLNNFKCELEDISKSILSSDEAKENIVSSANQNRATVVLLFVNCEMSFRES